MKRKKTTNKTSLKYFNTIEVVIIMLITCLSGMFLGSIITFVTTKTKKNNSSCEEIVEDKYIKEFKITYNNIINNYYEDVNKNELLDSAINGMIEYLDDPYANFLNSEESISFNQEVEGTYTGIGCELTANENNEFYITKIFSSSPAEEAKLKLNDIVLEIDGIKVKDKTIEEVSNLIKGENNTKITLKVKSNNEEKIVNLIRKTIEIQAVSSRVEECNNKKIGIIDIDIFSSLSSKQFKNQLKELEKKNIDALVIDLRDNNGGYLSSATEIASMFLQKNKIIYQLNTKGIKEPILDETKEKRTYKVAVLINEESASASEILAMALKESCKATIIGVKSYGKGTIQKAYNLEDGSMFKYTIQNWLTPSGESIDGKGITPDIEEKDLNNQMTKAIETLAK